MSWKKIGSSEGELSRVGEGSKKEKHARNSTLHIEESRYEVSIDR